MKVIRTNSMKKKQCNECYRGLDEDISLSEIDIGIMRITICDSCFEQLMKKWHSNDIKGE